eukprot:gnl/TRDRNA2_/TRDRNA2_124685_c0_seq2.p1 gnl/TRDRNA2_/TRDRNA2_124685_c0~~gnl/TRDRNA2_/TRDRNA2_124685_c0_seq2.p1  ORF type:complete len:239 (-),score=57.21 gnl/TRDRNA2_/TRDRNA2_124685_c0_seq2:142-783(-)
MASQPTSYYAYARPSTGGDGGVGPSSSAGSSRGMPRIGARMSKLSEAAERIVQSAAHDIVREDLSSGDLARVLPPDAAYYLPELRTRMACEFVSSARAKQQQAMREHRAAEHCAHFDALQYGEDMLPMEGSGAGHYDSSSSVESVTVEDEARRLCKEEQLATLRRHIEEQNLVNDKQVEENERLKDELEAQLKRLDADSLALLAPLFPASHGA